MTASKNTREHYILECLELVMSHRPGRLNVVEVGCMFKEDEGLSTYNIARRLAQSGRASKFVSIDLDPDHINASRRILRARDPALAEHVEFRCADSRTALAEAAREMGAVQFAFLDGSGHPGICLKEFEIVASALDESGICLVDDISDTKPTEYYSASRVFGKGTLIYPLLVMAEYVEYRNALMMAPSGFSPKERPLSSGEESEALLSLADGLDAVARTAAGRRWRIVRSPNGAHGMLVYGRNDMLASIRPLTSN